MVKKDDAVEYFVVKVRESTTEKMYPIVGQKKDQLLSELELVRTIQETLFYYPLMVQWNIRDFYNMKHNETRYHESRGIQSFALSSELLVDQNRIILNLLTSFRAYVDNVTHMLHLQFGKDCEVAEKFKEMQSRLFDDSFEYRFMCKYRNYVQHVGLPIHENVADKDLLRRGSLKLVPQLVTEKLLKQYDRWGPVKADLQKRQKISLLEVLEEFQNQVDELHVKLSGYVFSNGLYSIENVLTHYRNVKARSPDYSAAVLIVEREQGHIRLFPEDFLSEYERIMQRESRG